MNYKYGAVYSRFLFRLSCRDGIIIKSVKCKIGGMYMFEIQYFTRISKPRGYILPFGSFRNEYHK